MGSFLLVKFDAVNYVYAKFMAGHASMSKMGKCLRISGFMPIYIGVMFL